MCRNGPFLLGASASEFGNHRLASVTYGRRSDCIVGANCQRRILETTAIKNGYLFVSIWAPATGDAGSSRWKTQASSYTALLSPNLFRQAYDRKNIVAEVRPDYLRFDTPAS
jgi:hypothetical protein